MAVAKKYLTERLLIGIICAVALLAAGPTLAGYARGLAALPVYGAVCGFGKIFGSAAATPDEYRSFVLDRGCDIDAAIRGIVTAVGPSLGPSLGPGLEPGVDPQRIVAIYHGSRRAESGDELSAMSTLHSALRAFPTSAADDACAAGADCAASYFPAGYDLVGLFNAYVAFVRAHFLDAVDDGADYIAATLRMGPIGQAIVLIVYAAAALIITKKLVDLWLFCASALAKKPPPTS
jgi:hypothetical protein